MLSIWCYPVLRSMKKYGFDMPNNICNLQVKIIFMQFLTEIFMGKYLL